jgi:glycine/D-amino acid oxidase-like deaminating enzyme
MDGSPGTDYDVLIVGARVAGASLALLLGLRGHRVLMVDRDHFPSDTLSTHFMGALAVPLLAYGFLALERRRAQALNLADSPGGARRGA